VRTLMEGGAKFCVGGLGLFGDESLALFGVLALGDVDGDAVEAIGDAVLVEEDLAGGANPFDLRRVVGRDGAIFNAIRAAGGDGSVDCVAGALAIVGVDAGQEEVIADGSIGIDPEVLAHAGVPALIGDGKIAEPEADLDGLGDEFETIVIFAEEDFAASADAGKFEVGLHASEKFAGAERLGEVIVGAALEALDAGGFSGAGREQDDWNGVGGGMLAQFAQKAVAVELGHHHVGKDEVGGIGDGGIESGAAVGVGIDFVIVGEKAGEILAHVGVVVGEENTRTRAGLGS